MHVLGTRGIHCSLSCIQLLSWPVHWDDSEEIIQDIYMFYIVLHCFTMKVVWVDPAKENTCFTNTMNGPGTDLVLPRVFAILRGPRHFYFWRRSPTKSSIFCSWNHLHMLDKIVHFPVKSQKIVLKSGGTSGKSSKTPANFLFFPIFSGWNAPNPPLFVGCPMGFGFLPGVLRSHRGERGGRLDLVRLLGCRWGSPGELRGSRGRAMGKSHGQPGVKTTWKPRKLHWKLHMLNMLCIFVYHVWGKNNVKPLNKFKIISVFTSLGEAKNSNHGRHPPPQVNPPPPPKVVGGGMIHLETHRCYLWFAVVGLE